uniref:Double-stranded RNA-binding protein 4 n=1 Tax=Anthurium amnicola TaxID=1678845 RepID=A0A1D1YDS3_9ARAE
MEVEPPSHPGVAEKFMQKNRLQVYAQRSALPLPVYLTVNEGFPHAPQFRSTVLVGGVMFRSSQTFAHRKEAEQDVAKVALEGVSKKINEEGCPLIHADTVFCKSILHEYAVQMNLDKPTYTCSQPEGLLPMFISSVLLDGKMYKGAAGRKKKQAEQLAARAAIESILGDRNPSTKTRMSQIIKSKGKLYSALHQVNVSGISEGMNTSSGVNLESLFGDGLLVGKEVQVALRNEISPVSAHVVTCNPGQLSERKQQNEECMHEISSGMIGSGTELQHQPQGGPALQQANACPQTVADGPYLSFLSHVKKATLSVGPSGFSFETHGTWSNRKRKRSKKGKGK